MENSLSIYIHIPFCIKKHKAACELVCEAGAETRNAYLAALTREIDEATEVLEGKTLQSLYVGGGASLLAPDDLARLLLGLKRRMEIPAGMEFSIRFLPETLISPCLSGLNMCSFNRVCIEALCEREKDFRFLGTSYDYAMIEEGINMLSLFKYPNCDIELLYGLPEQNFNTLRNLLTIYTNFHNARHITLLPYTGEGAQDEVTQDVQFVEAVRFLTERGYVLYAANRFAKPGAECRFFYQACMGLERLGFGLGAKSCLDGYSYANTTDLSRYIERAGDFSAIVENPLALDAVTLEKRRAALRFQLSEGLSMEEFPTLEADFARLVEAGYAQMEAGRLQPTLAALSRPERARQLLYKSAG